ncbi:MAG: D-glycero-beta-D-manno-heptose-7-phosphate kinase [Aquificota bacterium]
MERSFLKKLLQKFKNLNIAVVGDVILDKYLFGKVERISPEAPVPIFEIEREEFRAGGAANVALNLSSLGVGKVSLFGVVGKDPEGEILKNLLKEKGIEAHLLEDSNRPTTRKTRIVAKSQHLLRIDREQRKELDQNLTLTLVEKISLNRPQAIIVSDYAKGVITPLLMEELKKLSIPIFVDPRPKNALLYEGVECITPNRKEFEEISTFLKVENNDFENRAREVKRKLQLKTLVITLGEKGIALLKEEKVQYFPATAKEVFDVTGAGDTVIATLTAARTAGADWETACRLANLAAGIVVGKLGTATATPEEILNMKV